MLSREEASLALSAVLDAQAEEGPRRLGSWQLASVRAERLWNAAVALAPVAERLDEAARRLLQLVEIETVRDELLDRALARAADTLDLSLASEQVKLDWRGWSASHEAAAIWPTLVGTVRSALGSDEPESDRRDLSVATLAEALNEVITGRQAELPLDVLERGQTLLRDRLTAIRRAAADNTYHVGGISDADVAVGLAIYAGAEGLWDDLVPFLVDPRGEFSRW